MRIRDEGVRFRAKSGKRKGQLCNVLSSVAATDSDSLVQVRLTGEQVYAAARANDMLRVQWLVPSVEGLWGSDTGEIRKRNLERVHQVVTWEPLP